MDALSRAGAIVVVASGNYHQEADITTRDTCRYSPASAYTAISVGATHETDQFASFSNDGPCVTLLAPGVSILSLDRNNTSMVKTWYSGTSYSAPHVAGVAALLWANSTTATKSEQILQQINALTTFNVIRNVTQGTPTRFLYNGMDTYRLILNSSITSGYTLLSSSSSTTLVPLVLVFYYLFI